MAKPFTIYKLTILNMLDKVDFSLTNTQICNFFLQQEYTGYFQAQQAIAELVDAKLVLTESTHNNTLYSLTAAGKETLDLFRDKITDGIDRDITAYLEMNQMRLRNDNAFLADYDRTPDKDYAVRCRFQVRGKNPIDLTLTVPDKNQANAICENWKKQSEQVYAYLMDILIP